MTISKQEYADSQIRRMLTLLFTKRAKRHLKTLADSYGWSEELLAEYEERFIKPAELTPLFLMKNRVGDDL